MVSFGLCFRCRTGGGCQQRTTRHLMRHANVLAKASREHKLDASLHIQEVEHPASEVDLTPASARTPSRFQTGQQNAAATYSTQLSQVVVTPTEPPMEEPQGLDLDQSDWDCSDDDFDPRFIGVTIHNLSHGGTVWEKSNDSDHSTKWHDADTSRLATRRGPSVL